MGIAVARARPAVAMGQNDRTDEPEVKLASTAQPLACRSAGRVDLREDSASPIHLALRLAIDHPSNRRDSPAPPTPSLLGASYGI